LREKTKKYLDIDELGARMKRLKGIDMETTGVSQHKTDARVFLNPNSDFIGCGAAKESNVPGLGDNVLAWPTFKSKGDTSMAANAQVKPRCDGNMVDHGNDVGNSGATNIPQVSRVNEPRLSDTNFPHTPKEMYPTFSFGGRSDRNLLLLVRSFFLNRSIIIKLRLGFHSFWYDRMYYMGLFFFDLLGLLCVNDQRNPLRVLFYSLLMVIMDLEGLWKSRCMCL
jgi:hypothetical protein